jgi:anti-sigma factor ChrR (cupin superfamily)
MQINTDFTRRAVVDSDRLPWIASPLPGVERRMLERDGDEVARATSLVRYAPGSRFSAHLHAGGEEFLVLDGTFSDDDGNYPAGTYVRNPVGSRHTPHSDTGTTILVKLSWMHPEDRAVVRIDTTRQDRWRPASEPGVAVLPLHAFGAETAALYRLAPGASIAARDVPGGEEIFVVDGEVRDPNGSYGAATWIRAPIGAAPALGTTAGARLFVKRGHLRDIPPGPGAPRE